MCHVDWIVFLATCMFFIDFAIVIINEFVVDLFDLSMFVLNLLLEP